MASESGVTLVIPYPPTVNHFHVPVRGRKITSKEGRAWISEAITSIHKQICGHPFWGDVKVYAELYRPRRAGDLSNRIKPVEDVLEKAGVLNNDNQIAELHWVRMYDKNNPRVVVTITPLSPPVKQEVCAALRLRT